MSTIVTRAGKGSPLTNTEVDTNFTNLNTDKLEINAALGTPASVTLTNATGLPTAGLVDNAVTNAKLRDSAALSVIGRGANSTGDPADIVAGTNHQVLRRDGSSLAFGAVDLSSNQAVTGTLPVNQGGTGITSFGSGVATFLGTPSSANLAAAVTDETGSGALVFATSPTLVTPILGTPQSGTLTNATGLPLSTGVTGTLPVGNGGTGATTLTANNVLLGNGTSAVQVVAPGTSGNVLTSNGSTWVSQAAGASLFGDTDSASPFETALGYQAGNVTTGVNNTWVGYQAGLLNTSGENNTAVGFAALDANTTGGDNAVLGILALSANTTGNSNVALGSQALLSNTTASGNVAVGTNTLLFNTTGAFNVAVGQAALFANTTASNNIAIGRNALGNNTTATDNVAVGYQALDANTTGQYNIAMGTDALGANTTGFSNVAMGYNSLKLNTTGAGNTALGDNALSANTTGENNSALGNLALASNTEASANTAVGYRSLFVNTTGISNVSIGYNTLDANTTGSNNTAMGTFALGANTTGINNTAVGYDAGDKITTGTQNVTLGTGAASSGTNDLTTGSNNIIIGYNAEASSATVSNEVTLGNSSITSTRLRGMVELNAAMFEKATISATAATGTINFDARTQSVLYYTSNASGNWTLNIRAASGVSLDSVMTTGESMTIAFMVTNGATAYYQTAFQVDGSSVTPKWQGGAAPTAGNASSIDAYVITVIKTGTATFTALASQTAFA